MWLVLMALKRPVTILVAVMSIALSSILAIRQMKVDIFPKLGAPAIYVAQPYGGMDPSQMEGYLTYYYEYHFLYITGIEHVESKNIQGVALMKLVFHPDTDMSQAMAEVVGYVNRVARLHAARRGAAVHHALRRGQCSGGAIGLLQRESQPGRDARHRAEPRPADLRNACPACRRLRLSEATSARSWCASTPSACEPIGSRRKKSIAKINKATTVLPSGSVRTGDLIRFASTNAALGANIAELLDTPLRLGSGPTVYLRDIGTIADSTDVVVGYAHVDGKRTVYIPVTKRADASTLSVIQNVRQALPADAQCRARRCEDRSGVRPVRVRRQRPKGADSRRTAGCVSDRIDGAAVSSRLAQRSDRDHHDSASPCSLPSCRSGSPARPSTS